MSIPYVIVKNGMFYAHNSAGYVSSIYCAELYSEEYAKQHAENIDGCKAFPVGYFVESRESAQEYIDRIEAIRDSL